MRCSSAGFASQLAISIGKRKTSCFFSEKGTIESEASLAARSRRLRRGHKEKQNNINAKAALAKFAKKARRTSEGCSAKTLRPIKNNEGFVWFSQSFAVSASFARDRFLILFYPL